MEKNSLSVQKTNFKKYLFICLNKSGDILETTTVIVAKKLRQEAQLLLKITNFKLTGKCFKISYNFRCFVKGS